MSMHDEDDIVVEAEEVEQDSDEESMDTAENKEEEPIPVFQPLPSTALLSQNQQFVSIPVPPHRYTPLKNNWPQIYQPIVEHMKLKIRFNPKKRAVEIATFTAEELKQAGIKPEQLQQQQQSALTKSADFVRAFLLGFDLADAIVLLRLDDIFIDSFEIKDVRRLEGEHLSRAIGRIAGQGGKTKFTIENATKTRIVLADTHIHILGSFQNINLAKTAIVKLIQGSPPAKVYTQMKTVANRMKERF